MDPEGDSDSCYDEAEEGDMAEVVDLNEMEGGGKDGSCLSPDAPLPQGNVTN